jgi:hypothetical protein
MTVEEALILIKQVFKNRRLNKIQEIILRQCWDGFSYSEIAYSAKYDLGYVKDVGSKLWRSLSEALGEKVTKNNFRLVLQRYRYSFSEEQSQLSLVDASKPIVVNDSSNNYQDWGEAMDVTFFWGRATELAALERWIVDECCRLTVIVGMGGMGKTALTVKFAQQIQTQFKYLIWRSLRNALPFKDLIAEIVLFLSQRQEVNLPETVDAQISRLMEYLRSTRCLLILDNFESILQSGKKAGRYRKGYEGYGQFLRRVGDEKHQSCLIVTSREMLNAIANREEEISFVRSLQLTGLEKVEAEKILQAKGLAGSIDEFQQLIDLYKGNPLTLKIAATTIKSFFDGDILLFFQEGIVVFADIWDLLDGQFNRLSVLEQKVMYWLAINRRWITLAELQQNIVPTVSHRELVEALLSLQARSLIEKQSTSFTLQPVVMEYVTERLLSQFYGENINLNMNLLTLDLQSQFNHRWLFLWTFVLYWLKFRTLANKID